MIITNKKVWMVTFVWHGKTTISCAYHKEELHGRQLFLFYNYLYVFIHIGNWNNIICLLFFYFFHKINIILKEYNNGYYFRLLLFMTDFFHNDFLTYSTWHYFAWTCLYIMRNCSVAWTKVCYQKIFNIEKMVVGYQ